MNYSTYAYFWKGLGVGGFEPRYRHTGHMYLNDDEKLIGLYIEFGHIFMYMSIL
jgi:hypothetical protein